MDEPRFRAVVDSTDELLEAAKVGEISGVAALLMTLFRTSVTVTEVRDTPDGRPRLEIVVGGSEWQTALVDYPVSIMMMVRTIAGMIDNLRPDTEARTDPFDGRPVAEMSDEELHDALQERLRATYESGRIDGEDHATLPAGADRPGEAQGASRERCPSCGSSQIIGHPVQNDPEEHEDPTDVGWTAWSEGRYPGAFRKCVECGASWRDQRVDAATPIRLLSYTGASFAVVPAPSLVDAAGPDARLVDIDMLTPDRLVTYLGRVVMVQTFRALAETWLRTATEDHPEQTVEPIQDERAGLSFTVVDSTDLVVTVEVVVVPDLSGEVPGTDGIRIEVSRASLISAAHAAEGWLL